MTSFGTAFVTNKGSRDVTLSKQTTVFGTLFGKTVLPTVAHAEGHKETLANGPLIEVAVHCPLLSGTGEQALDVHRL